MVSAIEVAVAEVLPFDWFVPDGIVWALDTETARIGIQQNDGQHKAVVVVLFADLRAAWDWRLVVQAAVREVVEHRDFQEG